MAIVQAGNQFTVDDLQRTAGRLATAPRDAVTQGNAFRVQLESWPDADLAELGLAPDEINAIKGFYVGDLPPITTALQGSVWLKQLLGVGV